MPADAVLTLTPIGTIRTPFTDRYRAPRQPGAGTSAEGVITLNPGHNFEQALADLAGFEKVWLLYWFNRNTTWKPKVLPPRGPRIRRGVFATRSPHRPNPLGLSLATLLEVSGRKLRVGDIDLLDGTPILDIKPYLPYAEAFPNAKTGWLGGVNDACYSIVWSALAKKQLAWLRRTHAIDLAAHAAEVLSHDPSPHPYRRISAHNGSAGILQLALKSWRLAFSVEASSVTVHAIESGYASAQLITKQKLHDQAAHIAFHQRWPAEAHA